ncbi:efflux RND transporter periplasmic adaptor subunit [Roseicella sp. DB1501]|uniref:efflux RND transporter periplasmic adaptor subunit n=1 Tax=Roseicella sp. DB1501 TaxID=2730925 RepID=UPI001490CE96|nr:efflux RND transporter periplasmic adaptor subunit [Roseicella sp. DB1501]NOG71026.1 efflux RND transporter periplasmic adaptor subunit [Roseicella sp. DB1501]
MRRPFLILLGLAVLAGAGAWVWHQRQAAPTAQEGGRPGFRGAGAPVPVTAAAAKVQDVPISLDAIGTVQAFNTITVRPQVDGQLVEIAFQEGQMVKQGDLLARIDPRSYQAALDQAVAKKAQDEALLANARLDLQRYTSLAQNQGISRQQQDTQRALVAQYEAQVAADQGAIDAARTQLSFTTIRSPINGRVGLRLVDQGNVVHSGDATGIVTVSQLQPIAVVFTLPQQELGRVQAAMQRGKVPVQVVRSGPSLGAAAGTLPPPRDATVQAEGELLTIDNAVDAQTGTIKLKASFANEDFRLWPGAFVNVRLEVERLPGVTTVPLVAVQRGPDGAFAFVLGADHTVEQRPLRLGALTNTEAVVQQGLRAGEQVVTSGALRLSPGTTVMVNDSGGNGPGPAPPPGEPRRRPRQAADARP